MKVLLKLIFASVEDMALNTRLFLPGEYAPYNGRYYCCIATADKAALQY